MAVDNGRVNLTERSAVDGHAQRVRARSMRERSGYLRAHPWAADASLLFVARPDPIQREHGKDGITLAHDCMRPTASVRADDRKGDIRITRVCCG